MIRASYQQRLSAMILGIRPSAAHVYGAAPRTPVDNLTEDGISAWQAGLRLVAKELVGADDLSFAEQWAQKWIEEELDRDTQRWDDASSILELLALSLGPMSLDPSHLRPNAFWLAWERNLQTYRARIEAGRTHFAGDTADLAFHCADLVLTHNGPVDMQVLLGDVAELGLEVQHQPDVFRPLTNPLERVQLSAMIAASYDVNAGHDCQARNRSIYELAAPAAPQSCSRRSRV